MSGHSELPRNSPGNPAQCVMALTLGWCRGTEHRQYRGYQGASAGGRFKGDSVVPGAQLLLNGPVNLQTESDANGQYNFPSVIPGTYTIQATAPGLEAQQSVSINPGETIEVSLQLQLAKTTTDVTVTANSTDAGITTTNQTVEQKTIDNAPNSDQKFETLLPLVPGVVRGPDGKINMKGARNTQSGALVNSANVTDPASGGPAINLPIDVVSSVQVVSNPFDPQYGRFTGALSTVETKTANYEKVHFSIQNIVPRWRERAGRSPDWVQLRRDSPSPARSSKTGPPTCSRLSIGSCEHR